MTEVPRRLREQILERDEYTCQGCGQSVERMRWWSLQHRQARGVGGGNHPSNLVVLCGSATSQGCHFLCEARDAEMRARGFWVPSWQDPAEVPVVTFSGRAVYLEADGTYREA